MRFVSTAEITANEEVASQIFLLTVAAPLIAHTAAPGQFCMIAAMPHGQTTDPLLKRPLSIHRVQNDLVSFLYRKIGHGTTLLSQKKAGESLEIIGPLGHGFDLTSANPVLVGGGMGMAPMLFAAEEMYARKKKAVVVLGARNAAELPKCILESFQRASHELHLMTEDGSLGEKGLVTAVFPRIIEQKQINSVLACGPWPMLKAVNVLAQESGVFCQVSLEAHMACGIGACLGCAVKAKKDGYLHVCKDGPVVDSTLVDWE